MQKNKINSDYNSKNFAFAFLGKSLKKYVLSVIFIACIIFISFLIIEYFLKLDLVYLFFQYPTIGFNIELIAYYLTFPLILILSRGLFLKSVKTRNFFLGKEICDIHGERHCLECSRIDESKVNKEKFEDYWANINMWIKRAYGKKWLSIATAILLFSYCSILFPNLIWGDIDMKWWAVLDLFLRIPLFFAVLVTIINCLITNIVIYKMTKWEIKISILHPDGVGGLKAMGDLTFRNLFTYASIIALTMIGISVLYVFKTPEHPASLLNLVLIILGFVVSTTLVMSIPLYYIHLKCISNKNRELEKISNLFDKNYKKYEVSPNMQLAQTLILLNIVNDQVEQLKSWPWSAGLIGKILLAILSPLIIQLIVNSVNLI